MIGNRHEIARLQGDFYRDKYRGVLRWLLFSFVLMVALICGIIYLVLFKAPSYYYATTIEGQIIPLEQAKSKQS
jgi:hypothetical protein